MIDLIEKYGDHTDIELYHNYSMAQVIQYISMESDMNLVYKALTTLAIETTLFKIGKAVYDKVVSLLNEKYQCYLPDCYTHPEYLSDVLKEVFGNGHQVIVKEIRKELKAYLNKDQVARFIEII